MVIPEHALLVIEERLKDQEREGVAMPAGLDREDLAIRILLAAEAFRYLSRKSRQVWAGF